MKNKLLLYCNKLLLCTVIIVVVLYFFDVISYMSLDVVTNIGIVVAISTIIIVLLKKEVYAHIE